MGLVCIDWDNTFMNGHAHKYLQKKGVPPGGFVNTPENLQDLMVGAGGFKFNDYFIDALKQAAANGHDICFVTHSDYPEALKALKDELAKHVDFPIDRVPVFAGFPGKNGTPCPSSDPNAIQNEADWKDIGKQQHIEQAMAHFGKQYPSSEILLIDDSSKNINYAKTKQKQQTIKVPAGTTGDYDKLGYGWFPGIPPNAKRLKQDFEPEWIKDIKAFSSPAATQKQTNDVYAQLDEIDQLAKEIKEIDDKSGLDDLDNLERELTQKITQQDKPQVSNVSEMRRKFGAQSGIKPQSENVPPSGKQEQPKQKQQRKKWGKPTG